jgi:GT2 family glycosyltransferase
LKTDSLSENGELVGSQVRSTVTVLIATRNRKESLGRVLASVAAQTIVCQVVCIDDASTDGTTKFIEQSFPNVVVKHHETNVGPAASRNEAARLATGEYLVTLDDDCVLARPDSIELALTWFVDPTIAAVTLPFVNLPQADGIRTAAPANEGVFATVDYYAGMVIFRRAAYAAINGYREAYFMHHEEADLAIRLLNNGWMIRSGHEVLIHHHESAIRNKERLWRLGARNIVLFTYLNVPAPSVLFHLPATVLKTSLYAARRHALLLASKGLLESIPACLRNARNRAAVSRNAYRAFRLLRRTGPLPLEQIKNLLERA